MAAANVTQEELRSRLTDEGDSLILDVRRQADYECSSLKIKGALHLPTSEIHAFSNQIAKDREIIVYSRFEKEDIGQQAVQELRSLGFANVFSLNGGFQDWLNAGLEMEPK